MSTYSAGIPSSFDPALIYSEYDRTLDAHILISHSDEIKALQVCIEEDKTKNNQRGVVIQHRAWSRADIFRSEEEYSFETPLRNRAERLLQRKPTGIPTEEPPLSSSPPTFVMPLVSSPIAYPPSSSMPQATTPKKRKRSVDACSPLNNVSSKQTARRVGAFLEDSDDEEDIAALQEHSMKRIAVNSIKELPSAPEGLADYTPPASQDEIADAEDVPVEALDEFFESRPMSKRLPLHNARTSAQPMASNMARTAAGRVICIPKKAKKNAVSFEELIAARSEAVEGKARTSYYGIDIHSLVDEAKAEDTTKEASQAEASKNLAYTSIEQPVDSNAKAHRTLMWTEKYRAKKFTDLVGDERTHRSVLRWLKAWDSIVFPGAVKANRKVAKQDFNGDEQRHRKILLLTGPPGLGKTTLAHVCARQAGYEVQEINASDERSRDIVKGRIRDMVGTENVRGISSKTTNGKVRKAGKPVCVVVDEVDGVVGGSSSSGGGEGGFIKALIDLINLDERNSKTVGQTSTSTKKKADKFRLLRPLILICNDLYHPSLKSLRQSSFAEIVRIRQPAMNMVVTRMQDVFTREGFQCDSDGVRRLCEATWGVGTKKEGGTGSGAGEGDIRGIMVMAEWVAGRLRSSHDFRSKEKPHLTKKWIEEHITNDLKHGGCAARSLGRGGAKDVVDRVFKEGAGFPKQAETSDVKTAAARAKIGVVGVAEGAKRQAMDRLREMVDTSGDCDRIVLDCFTAYPEKPFQDDTLLSKPTAAYEWLHFHDTLSSAIHGSQEWELFSYLSQSVLAFHNLFASPRREASSLPVDPDAQALPFTGPGASFAAAETHKASRSQLISLQSTLSLPLTRQFRSPEELATELIPYTLRMLSPDVKPVIINTGSAGSKSSATAAVRKSSEKALVKKAVEAMAATGIRFERSRIETEDAMNRSAGFVFRMEPPLDTLASFETLAGKKDDKVRYAVRSVLEMEWKKESARIDMENRKRRGGQEHEEIVMREEIEEDVAKKLNEANKKAVKHDFFGRVIKEIPLEVGEIRKKTKQEGDKDRIWVSFHEGFSNAVRKPITIDDLFRGL